YDRGTERAPSTNWRHRSPRLRAASRARERPTKLFLLLITVTPLAATTFAGHMNLLRPCRFRLGRPNSIALTFAVDARADRRSDLSQSGPSLSAALQRGDHGGSRGWANQPRPGGAVCAFGLRGGWCVCS